MTTFITSNLTKFTQALVSGEKINCNRKGEWYHEGVVMRFIRRLFGWEDARVLKVGSVFNTVLDKLEKIPVKFNAEATLLEKQKKTFDLYFKAAEAVKKQLEACKTRAADRKLNELNLRIVSLKYRIEEVNGGLSKGNVVDKAQHLAVEKLAQEWKNSYDLYLDKTLCLEEKQKLEEVCLYPEFVGLLKLDNELRDLFFKWALRDNCDVSAFVQFSTTSTRIKEAFLGGRIGRFGKQIHVIKYKNLETGAYHTESDGHPYEKHWVLPFEVQEGEKLKVKDFSVLSDNQVVNMNKNYRRTVKQIIATFANRNCELGNFELFGQRYLENGEYLGPRIVNHNAFELGPYNPETGDFVRPDFSKKGLEWLKQIPPFDTLDLNDIKKMYGLENIPEGKWISVARATRENPDLDFDKCHGFSDVLIPAGKGRYELYPFGSYAAEWPISDVEKALFITATIKAKIGGPDENVSMSQRQHALVPNVVTEKDGLELIEMIRLDLVKAQRGDIVFQFPWENCSWWCQKLFERLFGPKKYGGPIPNYFRSSIFDAQPRIQPLPSIFRFCRQLKGKLRVVIVKIIEFILCSWRGTFVKEKGRKVFKSVAHSKHMKKLQIYLPSALHERIISGKIKGIITMGNFFLHQTPEKRR